MTLALSMNGTAASLCTLYGAETGLGGQTELGLLEHTGEILQFRLRRPGIERCSMKCQFPTDKTTYGYIRQKDLLTILPFSPATLWRKVKVGTFVQPVKLSARITAWNKSEVYEWLKQQEAK